MEIPVNRPPASLPFVERHYHFKTIDSTNTRAQLLGELPARGIALITADMQTGGRGQKGNPFFSSVRGGIWASMVVPLHDLGSHFVHNRSISMAVRDTIAVNLGRDDVLIKWPNDIYIRDRKACGILIETMPHQSRCLIIGFGVNVNIAGDRFPAEIADIATSLMIESGREWETDALLTDILQRYRAGCIADQEIAHARYCSMLYGKGRAVEIRGKRGIYEDVLPDGRLCLNIGAELEYISSGPVRFTEKQIAEHG